MAFSNEQWQFDASIVLKKLRIEDENKRNAVSVKCMFVQQ